MKFNNNDSVHSEKSEMRMIGDNQTDREAAPAETYLLSSVKESHDTETEDTDTERFEWLIEGEEAGIRIDKFVADSMDEEISRSQVQQWIQNGDVRVNGQTVKANYKLQTKDELVVTIPQAEETSIQPEEIPLTVVYEDSDVIVINKPRGMVVHPAAGHASGTLVNALLAHCHDLSGINGVMRPGIVHRIDKDTSGLLMAAKNDLAHISLSKQLKDHSVVRKYVALVHGRVPHDHGTIDAPIGRDPHNRKQFMVTNRNSKHAVTHFAVVERIGSFTLLELKLETGRTHQIRVHMKYIGHPLVGDPVYSKSKRAGIDGQALHAAVLGFVHPRTGEALQFEAALPDDMNRLLERVRLL
ncbi:RluA family pseudouridine synthase [Paenibacillus sp. J2TS4]|uniref:RluA family pseudouridine synthase n=1 Tax=Paenibacillus sp. J2TS4 TaxID=2807194 RepID=UPI001B22D986|nr:RluA family pseudouridine synthase [Paenibacillus sp. J2TS4]GIP36411.1 putative RNA pseudouridine synthase YlyB [Paenibacillus sp. J2TS4]